MIRLVKRVTATAVWDIDGAEISLIYRKTVPEDETASKIAEYRRILRDKAYVADNSGLCDMFRFFGGVSFVKIGMVYESDFLSCFFHCAKLFAEEWATGTCCLHSKNIGYQYVFQIMLKPIKYDFQYILGEIPESVKFCELVNRAFEEYWTPVIETHMRDGRTLGEISRRIGDVRLSRYMMLIPDKTQEYINGLAVGYTERREVISLRKLHNCVFGDGSRTSFPDGNKELFAVMKSVVSKETAVQYNKFVSENHISMDIGLDKWTLYQHHGTALRSITFDFTQIRLPSIRYEVKCFMRNRHSGASSTKDGIWNALVHAVNRICENNRSVKYFADIDIADVKMLQASMGSGGCAQSLIMTSISACRIMMDYLCGGERSKDLNTPVPRQNPFNSLTLVNASRFSANTPYIPDCVLSELEKHSDELNETDRLVFRVFNETGMRAKEIMFLRYDCLNKAHYDGYAQLKYITYKTLKARRRQGLSDFHSVYVSTQLASEISEQVKNSKMLREQCGLPYIFLHQHDGYKVSMLSITYFAIKINKLIKRYNICDESGSLWHFSSRQCRKTLVVNMIENGATVEELVYQLGHLDRSTAVNYYAEVKNIKLAELNSAFFKKQFEICVSNDALCQFTEEERRLLYVDFRLGYRRVELGFCAKKLCDGACNNMSSMHHCVSCSNLCTGKQYLPYWRNLLNSEKNEMEQMLEKYKLEGIADYSGFIEFKRKTFLLSAYQDVVDKLSETEDKGL